MFWSHTRSEETHHSKQEPWPRPWTRPPDELASMTFSERLLDSVIRGRRQECVGTVKSHCHAPPNKSAPGWGYDCCFEAEITNVAGVQMVDHMTSESIDSIASEWNMACTDIFDEGSSFVWGEQWLSVAMTTFADQVSINVNISMDCRCEDRFRPLCKGIGPTSESGRCVAPTCDDTARLCHRNDIKGKLAQLYCPVTCGCDTYNSSLSLTGKSSGCPPSC